MHHAGPGVALRGRAGLIRTLSLSIPIALGAASRAEIGAPPREPFVQIPGHMEFSGRLLVRPAQASAPDRDTQARTLIAPNIVDYIADLDLYVVAVPAGSDDNQYAGQLLDSNLYEFVTPDWILYPLGSPNDPLYPGQWHLPRIDAPGAWRLTVGAPGTVLAFVDTGVDLTHPDLAPNLVPGYNAFFTSRKAQADGGKVSDDHGHGTSVAGSAVAIGNNSYGGCGVGWNLKIMPIRVTNPSSAGGGAWADDIIDGALWAANHGAKVINVSFSGVNQAFVETLGTTLQSKGALLVWPMDTLGVRSVFSHPHVVVVNGTDSTDHAYTADNWGPGVDIAAPAVNVLIPVRGGGYASQTGNSFAAPIVAGVAGLAWSLNPALTPAQIKVILVTSAKDIGPPGFDEYFGRGRVNASSAVAAAALSDLADSHIPPCTFCCPADLNHDAFVDAADYDLFMNAFAAQDPLADFNRDGFVDGVDFDLFMNAFEAGC